jgi:hypothetical protein
MLKKSFFSLFLFMASPLLTSCATVTEGATQQVSFKTVGAEDAYCEVQIGTNGYKYSVRPPYTLRVQRSKDPMFVVCHAPGNRTKDAMVESTLSKATLLNGVTAGTTAVWDAASGAMFQYPDEVTIDFSSALTKETPLPSYENKGALDSTAQGIEYMGPDTPTLESDKSLAARYKAAYDDAAKQEAEENAMQAEKERRINAVEGGFYGDKGHDKSDSTNPTPAVISPTAPSVVPSTSSKLGKPMFPSSTSF